MSYVMINLVWQEDSCAQNAQVSLRGTGGAISPTTGC